MDSLAADDADAIAVRAVDVIDNAAKGAVGK